ncbi:hypothetical protein TrST_g1729 [Triparma strigata]|uniref:Multidrug and toxic compound extrusion protein n=1 Tax=Triparma strigata TaxID=1606541 RepID=A0A9W7BIS4_9STRA|nr:hypothetical protein TrST_g1729 [Triparma strigata]
MKASILLLLVACFSSPAVGFLPVLPNVKFSLFKTAPRITTNSLLLATVERPGVLDEANNQAPGDVSVGDIIIKRTVEEKHSVRSIVKFAVPAMGVWLCGPVLSLIDTSAVGLFCGTIQQAALSPAVAITDYSALLLAFMFTATTNLIAGESTEGADSNASKILVSALQMSLFVGTIAGTLLLASSHTLLKTLIGNEAVDPRVFTAALKYVRIRALGLPAAVVIGSAQAACLGLKDIKSPLYVLAAAALVNAFCDAVLVPCALPLFNGAAGAAWATVFSQFAAMGLFWKWLTWKGDRGGGILKMLKWVKKSDTTKAASPPKPVAPKKEAFTTRGFLPSSLRVTDMLKLKKQNAKYFLPFFLPVTFTQVGRISAYVAMAHVVSSVMNPVSMASQQIILAIFYTLTPIADSLSLTGQSFVPELNSRSEKGSLINYNRKLIKTGWIFGAVMSCLVSLVPPFSWAFTNDPAVQAQIRTIVPVVAMTFSCHGVVCAAEGIMLGMRDLGFLSGIYSSFLFLAPLAFLRVKKFALRGNTVTPVDVWKVFFAYNVLRSIGWTARFLWLNKKAARSCITAQDPEAALAVATSTIEDGISVDTKIGDVIESHDTDTVIVDMPVLNSGKEVGGMEMASIAEVFEDKAVADLVRDFVQGGDEEGEGGGNTGAAGEMEHEDNKPEEWDATFDNVLKDLDEKYKKE